MAKVPGYPSVTSFEDRHGTLRYKFRKTGLRPATIPGEPNTRAFDDAYQAVIEGRILPKRIVATGATAEIVNIPRKPAAATLDACWLGLQTTAKWKKLQLESQLLYTRYAEEFLNGKIPGCTGRTGNGAVEALRPRHVAAMLDSWSDTPHKARTLYVVITKMMKYAKREEWIEYLPTSDLEDKPDTTTVGKESWPPHICAMFEKKWLLGTPARTAYELAKWLGIRRSDVALIRWDSLVTQIIGGEAVQGFKFVQYKGRNRKGAYAKFHPMSPMLEEALAPLDRGTGTILVRACDGQPYNQKTMTCMMRHWRIEAGIPVGYSFHGLRHAMGAMLADAGATATESKDVLGHATLVESNRYQKGRNQALTSSSGMQKVVKMVQRGGKT